MHAYIEKKKGGGIKQEMKSESVTRNKIFSRNESFKFEIQKVRNFLLPLVEEVLIYNFSIEDEKKKRKNKYSGF